MTSCFIRFHITSVSKRLDGLTYYAKFGHVIYCVTTNYIEFGCFLKS